MPRINFTIRVIEGLKPNGKRMDYWDGGFPGFGIRVSEQGRKSWVLMYRHCHRLRRLTLGTHPSMPLAIARKAARQAMYQVSKGEDPATAKTALRRADTVADLIAEYLECHAKVKKRSWKKDERILNKEILSVLGTFKASEVRRADIIRILEKIRNRPAPIMANRTLEVTRRMFNFAVERDVVQFSPCHHVSKPAKEVRRDRGLSSDEIRKVWGAVEQESLRVRSVFQLRLLTAQRGGEIVSMRWRDLDLSLGWWTIPGDFTKNGKEHRVFLATEARKIVKRLAEEKLRRGAVSPWVFPSNSSSGHLEHLYRAARRISEIAEVDFRGHDLRRTAATMMAQAGVSRFILGRVLNHTDSGPTSIYDRHSYANEKRKAWEVWAVNLMGILAGEFRSNASQ